MPVDLFSLVPVKRSHSVCAQGGINGREIVGNYYDAAITNVVNAMTQACGEVFMLVGSAWALDSAQEETRLGCALPAVPTYSVSPAFANAPLTYQPVPNPADFTTAGWAGQVAEMFPEEATNATVMFGNFAATIDTKDKVLQSYPEMGFEFLDCPIEYNIAGEPDWKPFAQRLKDCGAEVVYYSGQPYPNMQNLLDDAAQIDYHPIWMAESNSYLQSFADWNATGNGDNVYVRTAFTPFELSLARSQAMQRSEVLRLAGGLERYSRHPLAAAVVVSGIVAVTLSPMMSARLVHPHGRPGRLTAVDRA